MPKGYQSDQSIGMGPKSMSEVVRFIPPNLKELCLHMTQEGLDTLEAIMKDDGAKASDRIAAVKTIFAYGHGQPTQSVEAKHEFDLGQRWLAALQTLAEKPAKAVEVLDGDDAKELYARQREEIKLEGRAAIANPRVPRASESEMTKSDRQRAERIAIARQSQVAPARACNPSADSDGGARYPDTAPPAELDTETQIEAGSEPVQTPLPPTRRRRRKGAETGSEAGQPKVSKEYQVLTPSGQRPTSTEAEQTGQ